MTNRNSGGDSALDRKQGAGDAQPSEGSNENGATKSTSTRRSGDSKADPQRASRDGEPAARDRR